MKRQFRHCEGRLGLVSSLENMTSNLTPHFANFYVDMYSAIVRDTLYAAHSSKTKLHVLFKLSNHGVPGSFAPGCTSMPRDILYYQKLFIHRLLVAMCSYVDVVVNDRPYLTIFDINIKMLYRFSTTH